MAGIHQLWSFDPVEPSLNVLAGTTNEGLRDGPPDESWLAQPSGLAAADDRLWFVDSETSSLRSLANGVVATHVGAGLFDFGLVDGAADEAMLQHPLGVTLLPDGSVAVLDTYNGAVRRFDPVSRTVTTLAMDLREPSGALLEPDGTLLVVESAAHRLTRIALPRKALRPAEHRDRTQRPTARGQRRRLRGHGRLRAAVRPKARRPLRRVDSTAGVGVTAGAAGSTVRAAVRLSGGRPSWRSTYPKVSCTSPRSRLRATRATRWSSRRATSTSRTGASRSASPPAEPCL